MASSEAKKERKRRGEGTIVRQTVVFNQEEKYIRDFLDLPRTLYTRENIMQNWEEERKLLLSTHSLSKYFTLHKILVYEQEQAVARGILTLYPGDPIGYLGFFEAKEGDYARSLFEAAEELCRENGIRKLLGPVNCSAWIAYRQKTNHFDQRPYTGEPYNLAYYQKLWLENGFTVCGRWVSNYYDVFTKDYQNSKCRERLQKFLAKGYEVVSPTKKSYEKCLNEIYDLITELYRDFPAFKEISRVDFLEHFAGYCAILDFSMVKVAYYQGKAVGFLIGIPDYSNLVYGKVTLARLARIFLKKIRSKTYIVLYLGVKKEHRGLGNAMSQSVIENLKKKRAHCYGALIQEGKVTERYVRDMLRDQYEYLLYEKELTENTSAGEYR